MRFSKLFVSTFKEAPRDAVTKSHQLLLRGSFISQVGSGIYHFLPLGKKMLDKITSIVREKMNKAGAQEITMGFVTPYELWSESGRAQKYGPELLRFADRKGNDFVLSPTNEESVTAIARSFIKSYKQLPVNLYQINTKFRDEMRPRFGLLRGREFVMKDAYSFHESEQSLNAEFENMEATYRAIFDALGFKYAVVEADSGAIGGSGSKEFMVLAESGEDDILTCSCGYAANIEAGRRADRLVARDSNSAQKEAIFENLGSCAVRKHKEWAEESSSEVEVDSAILRGEKGVFKPSGNFGVFHTPGVKSVEALAEFFRIHPFFVLKAVVKKAVFGGETKTDSRVDSKTESKDSKTTKLAVFFTRGDDELEDVKAFNALAKKYNNVLELVDADESDLAKAGLAAGFVGPFGLKNFVDDIYFDLSLRDQDALICGANEADKHIVGVDLGAFLGVEYADLARAKKGDICPHCGSAMDVAKGIEVGHIFKLGEKYSKAMDAKFLDKNGRATPFIMGCYGIGVSRLLSALLEQSADEKGCVWGANLGVFDVGIVVSNMKDSAQVEVAEKIYAELLASGVDVLLDDRDERFGVKMGDFELLGYKYALIIGKGVASNTLELVRRKGLERREIALDSAVSEVCRVLN